MGTNNGRTQLRRLLDLVRTLENTNRGWRVAALASRYNVDQSRIYNDLKIFRTYAII